MKNILFITVMIYSLLLVGCHPSFIHSNDIGSSPNGDQSSESLQKETNDPLPSESIDVRSLAELNEMRQMISCTDDEKLNQYLLSVEGGGAHSRDDLIGFLKIIDSLPFPALIEGDIVWLSHSRGQSQDTGENYDIVYISTQAPCGDWVRIEYYLSVSNIEDKIEAESLKLTASSILLKPIQNANGDITIFSETREIHPTGTGNMIKWIASIDGIFANVIYYTENADAIVADDLYRNLTLSHITDQ